MKWEIQHAHCVGRKHTKAARHTAHYGAASNTFSTAIVERANARDGHAQWKGNLNAGALIDKGTTAAFLRFIEFLSLYYTRKMGNPNLRAKPIAKKGRGEPIRAGHGGG